MRNLLFLLVLLAVNTKAQKALTAKDLKTVAKYLSGSFSSREQSQSDSAYFDIRLHMKQMWTHRKGEYWLYVEQAMASALDKPYRQRIYKVVLLNDTTISSTVYTLKDPLRFAGEWKKKEPCSQLTPDSLDMREGCIIYLHKQPDGTFAGSTDGVNCPSNLRGATYATSEVILHKKMLLSWDRGFSAEDKQVWGAVKGGYRFIKEESYPIK